MSWCRLHQDRCPRTRRRGVPVRWGTRTDTGGRPVAGATRENNEWFNQRAGTHWREAVTILRYTPDLGYLVAIGTSGIGTRGNGACGGQAWRSRVGLARSLSACPHAAPVLPVVSLLPCMARAAVPAVGAATAWGP